MPENLYNISDIDNPEVQSLINTGILNPQDTDPFGSALAAGAITPEQFQSFSTLQYAAEQKPFEYKPGEEYIGEARGEISPYYASLYAGLSDIEEADIEEVEETYDDLAKNLQDEYNRRGLFFGGEAMVGAEKVEAGRGRAITGVRAGYTAEKAGLRLEERQAISDKVEILRQRDYDEYWTERTESINQQVLTDLAEWMPQYTQSILDQMEDANALWIDIPLEDEPVTKPTVEPTPEPTLKAPKGQPRDTAAENVQIGTFGKIYGKQPSSDTDWSFVKIATYGYTGPVDKRKEKIAVDSFINVYGKKPETDEEWNIVAAIAYSGAGKLVLK